MSNNVTLSRRGNGWLVFGRGEGPVGSSRIEGAHYFPDKGETTLCPEALASRLFLGWVMPKDMVLAPASEHATPGDPESFRKACELLRPLTPTDFRIIKID